MDGLIFSDPGGGRGTHALVVGVGHYPNLGSTIQIPGLNQLDSPPRSAREFARWLLEEFHHADYPLRSVSLLLSEQTPAPLHWTVDGQRRRVVADPPASRPALDPRDSGNVEVADWKRFSDAAHAWRRRGHEHFENQMLFFFSGHGLGMREEVGLLLADFGEDELGALTGVVNINHMRQAATLAKARKQVWFIDACRNPLGNLDASTYLGQSPIQSGLANPDWAPCINPIFHSTLLNHKAYAQPGGLTLYTEALIGALRGGGADSNGNGTWGVPVGQLQRGLSIPMEYASRVYEKLQIAGAVITVDFSLCELPGEPQIPTFFECGTAPETFDRRLHYTRVSNGGGGHVGPGNDFWRLVLSEGDYELAAVVPGNPMPGQPSLFKIRVPSRAYKVKP